MESFFSEFKKMWENQEYGKMTEIIMTIFVLVAPSFSFMFLYKRELFEKLDSTKLVIICLILNCIFLFIVYLIYSSLNSYKLKKDFDSWKDEFDKELDKLENLAKEVEKYREISERINKNQNIDNEEIKKISNKLKSYEERQRIIKNNLDTLRNKNVHKSHTQNTLNECFFNISFFVMLMWGLDINYMLLNVDISPHKSMIRFISISIFFSIVHIIFVFVNNCKKFSKKYFKGYIKWIGIIIILLSWLLVAIVFKNDIL